METYKIMSFSTSWFLVKMLISFNSNIKIGELYE